MTFLGVLVVFALALFLGWYWLSLNQERIIAKNRLAEAEKAAAAGNYDESVELLQKSLSVTKNETAYSNELVRCAEYAVWNGYYEKAEEMLETGRAAVTNTDIIQEAQEQLYCSWADFHIAHGAYESAVLVLEEGYANTRGRMIQEKLVAISGNRDEAEVVSRFRIIAEDIQSCITVRDTAGALRVMETQDFRNLVAKMKLTGMSGPVIVETSGLKCGLYFLKEGGAAVYYGDYSGEDRSGQGTYLGTGVYSNTTGTTYNRYCAEGSWVNDLPQGEQTEYSKFTYGQNEYEIIRNGNVKDGLWDGTVRTWYADRADAVYEPVYANGVVTVLKTSKQTGRDNVIAENAYGTLGIPDDMVGKKTGIIGYGD